MSPFPSSADSEGRAYRNASPGLRFFLTAALSLALMYLDHRGTYLEQVRAYLGEAMYPLQIAIDSPAASLRWVRENLALSQRLIAENEVLRRESLTTSADLQRLAALQAENTRLRALLDSRSRIPDRVVVGEILAVDMDPLRHRVILNKGGRDGAYEGQALIDATGVVGQITRDRRESSEAILITDLDHALPVEIVRNGLRTIAVGTGDMERLSIPFLTRNADIKAGDLLVTSGLGGAFPAGYPVGTVAKVDGSSGDAFLEITAKPVANLDRLHEVLLVFLQQGTAAQVDGPPPAAEPTAAYPAASPAADPPVAGAVAAAPSPTEPAAPATVTSPVVEATPNEETPPLPAATPPALEPVPPAAATQEASDPVAAPLTPEPEGVPE